MLVIVFQNLVLRNFIYHHNFKIVIKHNAKLCLMVNTLHNAREKRFSATLNLSTLLKTFEKSRWWKRFVQHGIELGTKKKRRFNCKKKLQLTNNFLPKIGNLPCLLSIFLCLITIGCLKFVFAESFKPTFTDNI